MEINSKGSLDGGDGLAVGLTSITELARRRDSIVSVLAAVLEAQNKSRLCKWLSVCCIGRDKLVSKVF